MTSVSNARGDSASGRYGLVDPTPELRQRLDMQGPGAVVAQVEPGSLASEAGMQPGDVIVSVQGKAVKNAAEARKLLADAELKKGVRLRVKRGQYGHFVILRDKS